MVFSWLLLRLLLLLIFVAKAVVSLSIEVQLKLRGLIMICSSLCLGITGRLTSSSGDSFLLKILNDSEFVLLYPLRTFDGCFGFMSFAFVAK